MKSADIKNRKWTEKERRALRRASELQADGDDASINIEDIPRLTEAALCWPIFCLWRCVGPSRSLLNG